jgi:lipopolysaccharide biosynthesis protein
MSRLFLFAGYNKNGIIDDALVFYVTTLSHYGDVVFVMDNDCPMRELNKLKPYVIYSAAKQHGEYDFGSYKRAYIYAENKKLFDNYDFIYFVNDSVYGPVSDKDIGVVLKQMERTKSDFVGMVSNQDEVTPEHVQSWFVGFRSEIAHNPDFSKFMHSITKQTDKKDIINKYEIGLSKLLKSITKKMYVLFRQDNHRCNTVYKKPWVLLQHGIPFIKKSAISQMLSYGFLRRTIKNDIIYNDIKSHGLKIKFRPFQYIKSWINML